MRVQAGASYAPVGFQPIGQTKRNSCPNTKGLPIRSHSFLNLCNQSISPDVSKADVREILLQHILTKVFNNYVAMAQVEEGAKAAAFAWAASLCVQEMVEVKVEVKGV